MYACLDRAYAYSACLFVDSSPSRSCLLATSALASILISYTLIYPNILHSLSYTLSMCSPQTSESRDRVGEKQTSINVPITSNGEGSRSTLYGAGNTEGASNGDGTSIYTSGGGSQSPTRIVSPDVASLRFRAEGKAQT